MYLAQGYYCLNVFLELLLFLITITKPYDNSLLKGIKVALMESLLIAGKSLGTSNHSRLSY